MYAIIQSPSEKIFIQPIDNTIKIGDRIGNMKVIFKGTKHECNLIRYEGKTILDELPKERLKALWDGIYTNFRKSTQNGKVILDNTSELEFHQKLLSYVYFNNQYIIDVCYRDRLNSSMTFGQMVMIMVAEKMEMAYPDFELQYNFQSLLP